MTPQGFSIQGATGPIQIPPGEFYFNTKARCRNLMTNRDLSRSARQVHACLELATMGWQRELAVIQDKNDKRPLTTTDIARQTQLDERDVRRSLDELQEAGLAERRSKNGGSLQKGNVEIYSWAAPRPCPKDDFPARAPGKKGEDPEWVPESWQSLTKFARRYRLSVPQELPLDDPDTRTRILEEGERIARDLEKAEEAAARFWESACAQSRSNKEERTERTTEITSSSVPSQIDDEATTTEQSPEPQTPPQEPLQSQSEASQNLSYEEPKTGAESEVKLLERQLGIDNEAAKRILRETRWARPDASAREIVCAAVKKARDLRTGFQNGRYDNMTGMLIRAIPKMAASNMWIDIRREVELEKAVEAERERLRRAEVLNE